MGFGSRWRAGLAWVRLFRTEDSACAVRGPPDTGVKEALGTWLCVCGDRVTSAVLIFRPSPFSFYVLVLLE